MGENVWSGLPHQRTNALRAAFIASSGAVLSGLTPHETVVDAQRMRIVNENEYYLKVKCLERFVGVFLGDNGGVGGGCAVAVAGFAL
jgi:hypothetical protein